MKNKNIEFCENSVSKSPQSPPGQPGLSHVAPGRRQQPATLELWTMVRAEYVAGRGSLRALAKQHGLSDSTVMKRAAREHWEARRRLSSSNLDAMVEATMQQRAEAFVRRIADETDALVSRLSESGEILQPEDRQGLRQLAATLKDISAVGRDTYQLGNSDDPKAACIVNLGFLQGYSHDPLISASSES